MSDSPAEPTTARCTPPAFERAGTSVHTAVLNVPLQLPSEPSWGRLLWRRIKHVLLLRFLRRARSYASSPDRFEGAKMPFRILNAQHNLFSGGMVETALKELRAHSQKTDARARGFALWVLACYLIEQAESGKMSEALGLLERLEDLPLGNKLADRLPIMKAAACEIAGHTDEARKLVRKAISARATANLWLARARLEADETARVHALNASLRLCQLPPIRLRTNPRVSAAFDRLEGEVTAMPGTWTAQPLVTVLIPAHNADSTIGTSLRSLLRQTYRELEILVIDDASTDSTAQIVSELARSDARIALLSCRCNSGPYVARNIGLAAAQGTFVTCQDADDWSHPWKIETQVRHLLANPDIVANTSQQARVEEDLRPTRRGNAGYFIQLNLSSLMFRREPVMKKLGYWDCVRFAGDSEFLQRLKLVFDPKAVVHLRSGPLSFLRQSTGSLTASPTLGYQGFKYGARLAYELLSKASYEGASSLRYAFPQARPFVVPTPMRVRTPDNPAPVVRKFDVVIASDFRLGGGTNQSNAEEIRTHLAAGLRTGLIQLSIFQINYDRPLNPTIFSLIDGERVDWLVYGEEVECDLLIVRHPWTLQQPHRYIPYVRPKNIRVIINQPPKRDYHDSSEAICDLREAARHLKAMFGPAPVAWHPIGPLVRQALEQHHSEEIETIGGLAAEDWLNIINLEEWRRPARPSFDERPIRICRHSRDQYVKWPNTSQTLLEVYPTQPEFSIHVLGGAAIPEKILGGLPANWTVHPFGSLHPKQFLADQDVFVYYTHPNWVESFGRSILEAMAVGVPVFLPQEYQPLFGDAARYAQPAELKGKICALMNDPADYARQVAIAHDYVRRRFGRDVHLERIRLLLARELPASLDASS